MTIILLTIFLLFCARFHKKDKPFDYLTYSVIFVVIVLTKTFIDIKSLPDLENYYWGYIELSNIDWLEIANHKLRTLKCPEIGFRYILKIGSFLGDFKWSLFIIAVIHSFAFIYISKKYSPYIIVSLIIFLLGSIQSFFVLRQWLAIAITVLSYPYIINRNWKMYILLMLLAFSFHQTAIIFFPIYYIYMIRNTKLLNFIFLATGIVLFILFTFLFNFFAESFTGYQGYAESSNKANLTTLMVTLCYLSTYVYFLKKDIYKDGINRLLFIMQTMNFIILLSGYSNPGVNRMIMYYTVANILSVPITMKYIHYPIIRSFYITAIILLLTYISFYGSNSAYINSI